MSLLTRLYEASFKGTGFLVENSSITFGQKTVVHDFPNTNKTEVEFLGLSEDEFSLDIYINSVQDDYLDKRSRLKTALSEGSPGILIHPYEGQVFCSVVGQVTLVENDKTHGIAKFSVTFKKTTLKINPSQASNNSSIIRETFITTKQLLNSNVKAEYIINKLYPNMFVTAKDKLNDLSSTFSIIQDIVPIEDDSATNIEKQQETFDENIVQSAQDPETLSEQLGDLFETIDGASEDSFNNITIYREFFTYGDDDKIITAITVEERENNANKILLNQYVQGYALSLCYNAVALINFEDNVQLDTVDAILEAQYKKIIDDFQGNARYEIIKLRNQTRLYLTNQEVKRVVDAEVQGNPLTKITYLNYGNLDNFNRIYELNDKADPSFYIGNIKLLTEAQ